MKDIETDGTLEGNLDAKGTLGKGAQVKNILIATVSMMTLILQMF